MRGFLRLSIVFFLFSGVSNAFATKLYWIGGSGNFNDQNHWSYQSGGSGGAKSPSNLDDVYFDENSFPGKSVINIIGKAEVNDLIFSDETYPVILNGSQNEQIIVNGNLKFNPWVENQFSGQFWFKSNHALTSVFLSLQKFAGDVYFEGSTQWNIQSNLVTKDNSTVYFNQGTFNLLNAGIYCGNFIAGKYATVINATNAYLNIKNKFNLLSNITYNDGKTFLRARINDPSNYIVPIGFQFSSGSRIADAAMACTITLVSTTNAKCPSGCDGIAVFNISAGCSPAPFCFNWTPNGCFCGAPPQDCTVPVGSYTVSNISACAGAYNVSITDTSGNFIQSLSVPITAPSQFNVFFTTKVKPSCNGKCDGYIRAIVTGGTSPYCVQWTPPGISHCGITGVDTLKNACAASYSVIITDANNCVSTQTFTTTLTQPAVISHTLTTQNILCSGQCTGSATDNVSGGTSPFTFTWAPVGGSASNTATSSTYTNLCVGTYTGIATDANGCKDTVHPVITAPPPIAFTKVPPSGLLNIPCNNTCNGSVGVTGVTGGTPGYTYTWAPAGGVVSGGGTSSTYSGLCGSVAGTTYTCTIKDANNCTTTATFTVISPPALTHTITATNPKCNVGATGSATVTEGGGAGGPYTFNWSPAGGVTSGVSPKSIYSGIGGGTYTVVSTDPNGCTDTATVVLIPPPAVTGTITTITNPTCPNLNNGKLCVTAGGGTPGYTYSWAPIGGSASCTPSTLTVTPGGTSVYSVTITDANLCTVVVTGTLTSPPQATVTAAVTNPLCAGSCTGTATLTPVGGTSPYTYQWSCSGTTLPNVGGQCGGTTCNYTVTDQNTCKTTGSVSFVSPPAIAFTKSPVSGVTNINCRNVCSGTVGVTGVSGGTAPYTFSWLPAGGTVINAATSSTYSNLCVGTYTCTIKDANNCTTTANFTVAAPPALSHTITATNPKCSIGSTGSATVTESGGASPFTFTWSPGGGTTSGASPSSIYSNIGAGTFSVNITDANGCLDSATVTLTPPTALTATFTTITNPVCFGQTTGKLCVTAGGGTPAYTYTWAPSAGSASCTPANLGAGTYSVTVTDINGCTVTISQTLTTPPVISPNSSVTNPSCTGVCNASATLTPTGGSGAGYTYQWSCSGSTLSNISGQCGGTTCNYTVTDGLGCKVNGSVTFVSPNPLTATISATALSCSGACTSAITSTVGGGTPLYTYAWAGSGLNPVTQGVPNQTNMCAGSYTLTVTDNNGCIKTATTTVTAPTALSTTLTPTNPSCPGMCDGSILASISGGTAPYNVSWTPAQVPPNTLNPTNLCAGTYTLNVTDFNGCTKTDTVTLQTPLPVTFTLASTDATCSGICNGTATVTASGGTPAYQYNWDNTGFVASATVSGLCAGNHTVVVKDSKGCVASTQFFTINQPNALTASVSNIIFTCNGMCNGGATASAAGGTPAYTYSWDGGPFSASTTINTLCIGSHTLTVQDANGCTATATFTVSPLVNIIISSSSTSVTCNNLCDATATANASGGLAPYTIQWVNSNTCVNVITCTGVNLCSGTQTVIATDANGCAQTSTLTIGNPPALTATTATVAAQCFGACTGSATVTPAGGTPAYSVNWSTGASGTSVSNLCPGTYTATINDANGCKDTLNIVIGTSAQFTVTPTNTPPSTCGASDGSISLAISGGTGPYTMTWTPGNSNTNPLSGIPAGTYTAMITDANGCDTTIVFGLPNVTGPVMSITNQINDSCAGSCNGSATVNAVGSGPITVSWSGGPSGLPPVSNSNLCVGSYVVQAVDNIGCVSTITVNITAPPAITATVNATNPSCNGGLGSATLTVSGGSGAGYTFNWDGVAGGNPQGGLTAGSHTVIITDGSNCTGTVTFTLTSPPTLSVTVIANNTLCSYDSTGSASANVTGGTPATSYTWTNSGGAVVATGVNISNVSNLPPGSYTVNVSDAGSCSTSATFTINAATPILPNFGKNDNLCNAPCTGSATVAPTGGTGTYTYTWSGVSGNPVTPTISGVCGGSYSVLVTDGNNCKSTTSFTIATPPALTVTVNSTNPTCANMCNGSATVTVSGGTGTTYTVGWSPNGCVNCPIAINLCANQYTITATDSNGCVNSQILVLTAPPALSPNVSDTLPTCVGDNDGIITSAATGGTPGYTYTWIPAVAGNVPTATNLPAGSYTLIVTDANNCKDTTAIVLPNPPQLTMTSSSSAASCNQTNGSITISSVNGNGAVTVNWLNPVICGSFFTCSNLGAGIYSVELTDSKGCKDTFLIPVTNSNGPLVTIADTNVTCTGSCNGTASVTAVSGPVNILLPYVFNWTPPNVNTQGITGLCPGAYISTVTDSLGCKTLTQITITEPAAIQDNATLTNATCFGINDGAITSSGSGGTPGTTGYTYTLDGTTTNTTGMFTNLSVGSHTVCISDSMNCSRCTTYVVNGNSNILSAVSSTSLTCSSNCNGTATLSQINGGNPPYSITWNDPNSQTGPIASNLCSGTYTATITDAAGCQAVDTAQIIAPTPITPNAVATNPACGVCDGIITLTPSGGTPGTSGYTYNWNTGSTSSNISNVCAGVYQVDIYDSLMCKQSVQIPVSNTNAPNLTVTPTNPGCGNVCNGSVTTTVSGGVVPYTYSWPGVTGSPITPSINGQCSGTYFVQVKDSVGCIATQSVVLAATNQFSVSTTMVNPPCTSPTGSIATNISGGVGAFTYAWSTGAITSGIGPVAAGTYSVIITDAGTGCTDTLILGLNNNANGPILTVSTTNVLCNGACNGTATVSAFNGSTPYTYSWTPVGVATPTVGGLCPGQYAVEVTDNVGCVTVAQVTVSEPNILISSLPVLTQPKCFNDCNGSINTVISGGTPVYTYTWNPSTVVGSGGSNLCAGAYSVTVTDINGCTITELDTLIKPQQLLITGTVTPTSCNTVADGAINTTTSGGTPSFTAPTYTYQWSGGSVATTSNISSIPIGTYTVMVTDSRNCKDSANFTVTSSITVLVNAGNDTTLCAVNSFVLNGNVSGSTGLQWIQLPNPPLTVVGTTATVTITPPAGTTTQYVLIGQNGVCVNSDTISITSNALPVPSAGPDITIFVGQSGSIGGSPTNPGGGTINWQPNLNLSDTAAANPVASPTVTTTYTVYVTNVNGCTGWDTVTVHVLPTFIIPNGFSPNSDGYNDVWMIDNITKFPDCEVEVYNRWGEQLFYSKGYGIPWNGTYQGKPVPVGTYYYVIRLNDKEKKFPDHYTGPITILR